MKGECVENREGPPRVEERLKPSATEMSPKEHVANYDEQAGCD